MFQKNVRNVSLIGIGVGIRILGEVKGQDFTDDTVSLLVRQTDRQTDNE